MPIPDESYIRIKRKADRGELDGQTKAKPSYWIETMKGGAGWFACMVWDGMGYPEPWDTGVGRYATEAEAATEACNWAANERIEYRS